MLFTAAMRRSGGDHVWASRNCTMDWLWSELWGRSLCFQALGLNSLSMVMWSCHCASTLWDGMLEPNLSSDTTGYGAILVGTVVDLVIAWSIFTGIVDSLRSCLAWKFVPDYGRHDTMDGATLHFAT